MEKISFIIPSHNNLRHLKNAYESIKRHAPAAEICIADDASTDGTYDWLTGLDDPMVKYLRVEEKQGHTILYDKLITDVASNEIITILHADMYIGPNYVNNMLKHLKPGVVVSATRVEPPLHPAGLEKIIKDFGMDFDTLDIDRFEEFVGIHQVSNEGKITPGIFAPWMIYKSDFLDINGHDPLFAPFPYEDSDIFNRMVLNGFSLIQSWDALVYHLTCRGHRWTEEIGKDDDMFKTYEKNARRNYLRKWGSWIENTSYHHPIIPPRYKKTLVIAQRMTNDSYFYNLLSTLEPWFDSIDTQHVYPNIVKKYINDEQPNTSIDIESKFNDDRHDIVVELNPDTFESGDMQMIAMLSKIIKDSGEPNGEYELGNLKVTVSEANDLNHKLIRVKKSNYDYL